jgi:hypothetical protein
MTTARVAGGRWVYILATCVIIVFSSACDPDRRASFRGSSSGGASIEKTAKSSESTIEQTYVLEQQVGVLAPGEERSAKFLIQNLSRTRWTFSAFETSCTCTVSRSNAPFVESGGTETVEVVYRAPRSELDDQRSVKARFKEAGAPVFHLIINAKVRDHLSIQKRNVSFGHVGRRATVEDVLDVENFSEMDFSEIKIKPSASWLICSVTPHPVAVGEATPRQGWRVAVKADTSSLGPGPHSGEIEIIAAGSNYRKLIDVRLFVKEPITVIPSQLFFGRIHPGKVARNKVLLQFSPGFVVTDPDELKLNHDLGPRLKIALSMGRENFLYLTADLTPEMRDQELISGKISVTFRKPNFPALEIPVKALVVRE